MSVKSASRTVSPWYKEPWAWMVVGPLFVVIFACSIFVTIAFRGADDVVTDNYYKDGRMLSQEFTSEEYTARLGLEATVQFEAESGLLKITMNKATDVDHLDLLVSHPAKQELDKTFALERTSPLVYEGSMDKDIDGKRYLRLSASGHDKEKWRLHGEIEFTKQHTITLK